MKYWFISDTHNRHNELHVPSGIDVVIHCGDESDCNDEWLNETEARDFFAWYTTLEIPHKLFTPGNHSTAVGKGVVRPDEYPNVQFLIHQQTELSGLVIFGSPYTPKFFEWVYMLEREELEPIWRSIPSQVDILVTHGPPKGILDVTHDFNDNQLTHVGSNSLTKHVTQRIKPKLHAFGHIHDEDGIRNFGVFQNADTIFVNCSCCDLNGRLVNHGVVVEIDSNGKIVPESWTEQIA